MRGSSRILLLVLRSGKISVGIFAVEENLPEAAARQDGTHAILWNGGRYKATRGISVQRKLGGEEIARYAEKEPHDIIRVRPGAWTMELRGLLESWPSG
jgi:hypothetical protein